MKTFKKRINRIIVLLLAASMLFSLTGCGKNDEEGVKYTLYYIASDENSIVPTDVYVEQNIASDNAQLISFLMKRLSEESSSVEYYAPLNARSGYNGYASGENQVMVDFDSESFNSGDVIRNVLIRAAVTKTLTQIKDITTVNFTVDNNPMLDMAGNPIGPMSAETFIENAGTQINADERTSLTLYFANEEGEELVKVTRNVNYSGNISMDKLVVEQLVMGPTENENAFPVYDADLQVINVTTQDGTCYVNLDSKFLTPGTDVTNEVYIYAIVDSLIELGTINKVQFLIDSDSNYVFRETMDLNNQFSRDLDIMEEQQ